MYSIVVTQKTSWDVCHGNKRIAVQYKYARQRTDEENKLVRNAVELDDSRLLDCEQSLFCSKFRGEEGENF